jgi:hypothetical protein
MQASAVVEADDVIGDVALGLGGVGMAALPDVLLLIYYILRLAPMPNYKDPLGRTSLLNPPLADMAQFVYYSE